MAKSSLIGGSFPELEALNKKKGTILADIDLLISDLKKVMAVYESVHSKLYAGAMDRVLSRKVSGYNFFKAFLSNAEDLKKRITKIDAIEKKGLKRAYHFLWESFFNIKRLWQKDLDVPVMADNADILKKELAASDDFDAISILKNHFSAKKSKLLIAIDLSSKTELIAREKIADRAPIVFPAVNVNGYQHSISRRSIRNDRAELAPTDFFWRVEFKVVYSQFVVFGSGTRDILAAPFVLDIRHHATRHMNDKTLIIDRARPPGDAGNIGGRTISNARLAEVLRAAFLHENWWLLVYAPLQRTVSKPLTPFTDNFRQDKIANFPTITTENPHQRRVGNLGWKIDGKAKEWELNIMLNKPIKIRYFLINHITPTIV